MLTRIVKMTFKEGRLDDFKDIFEQSKDTIRNFEGCMHVELGNDIKNKNVFFTYSKWKSEEALNAYRNSSFFQDSEPLNVTNRHLEISSAKTRANANVMPLWIVTTTGLIAYKTIALLDRWFLMIEENDPAGDKEAEYSVTSP